MMASKLESILDNAKARLSGADASGYYSGQHAGTTPAEEGAMVDLTNGLILLSEAAQKRRFERSRLREAVDVTVESLAKMARAGDSVTLDSGAQYRFVSVVWRASQWANREGSLIPSEYAKTTLTRNGRALSDPSEDYFDGSNQHRARAWTLHTRDEEPVPMASDDERAAFAVELGALQNALRAGFNNEAKRMRSATAALSTDPSGDAA